MKLWLDDIRQEPQGWSRTLSVRKTVEYLDKGNVSVLSLDHDLGNPEVVGTGYDVLLWIEKRAFNDRDFKIPKIKIHTANAPARDRMKAAVKRIMKIKHD